MINLGLLYQATGVAQDFVKAREWYERAADKGDAYARDPRDIVSSKRLTSNA